MRFHRYVSIPVKISMVLSRSACDDARPHWLIAPGRGHGRIELIRREVATAQSALSKLSIVGGSSRPRYLRSLLICAAETDRERLADKFRTRLAASLALFVPGPARIGSSYRSFSVTWIHRKSISDKYFRGLCKTLATKRDRFFRKSTKYNFTLFINTCVQCNAI